MNPVIFTVNQVRIPSYAKIEADFSGVRAPEGEAGGSEALGTAACREPSRPPQPAWSSRMRPSTASTAAVFNLCSTSRTLKGHSYASIV